MKRAALAVLLGAACVPASEELPPAGAAGFAVGPSPAARGEPFTTVDGWSVRFEMLVLQASVVAQPTAAQSGGWGSQEDYLWSGAVEAEIFTRALPVGPYILHASPQSRYVPASGGEGPFSERVEAIAVSPEQVQRFRRVADNGYDHGVTVHEGPDRWGYGPAIVFAARAERGERSVSLDLALNTGPILGRGPGETDQVEPVLEVRKNSLVLGVLTVEAERIFADGFAPIADADADADGRVTADELRAVEVELACEDCPEPPPGVDLRTNLLARLAARSAEVLVPR